MAILTFYNLRQSFAEVDIFSGLAASLPQKARVGLVGPNGIGKTTLLRILAGQTQPKDGTVQVAKGTRLGYLRQDAEDAFIDADHTVYEEMLTVFTALRRQETRLREMEAAMTEGQAGDDLLSEYGKAQEAFELAGGYEYEVNIQQVLQGLGFSADQRTLPLAHCSGGQKTRALLARLLLEKPDLLILDEPSNHLDIDALEWLESALRSWEGSILVVSHDRYFLDKVVDTIWEMSRNGLEIYRGNYTAYLQQREERWTRREEEFQRVRDDFLRTLDFIKRNIARDSTKDQAVGRLKRLIRHVRAVEAGGIDALNQSWSKFMADGPGISSSRWGVADVEAHIKALQSPTLRQQQITMRFETSGHISNDVLYGEDLEIGYPETSLFKIAELMLYSKERVALIGPNGAGKSTFLKALRGDIEPLAGYLKPGANLRMSYFAQVQNQFDLTNSVLDEFLVHQHQIPGQTKMLPYQGRDYLARFLFQGEDVFKLVEALSGGERSRLALSILALPITNFLVLDEPTNHLDIPAQEVLQDALLHFEGTVLLVTHDRYLVDQLATQIWEVRNETLLIHHGNYQSHLAAKEALIANEKQTKAKVRAENRPSSESTRRSNREAQRAAKALNKAEEQIAVLEAKLETLNQAMEKASHAQEWEDLRTLEQERTDAETSLEALMEEWETLSLQAEAL
ncbi:MAG: ABC-F family ATP-binding cassette domain-containing protein [Chloroflexota bacterium]